MRQFVALACMNVADGRMQVLTVENDIANEMIRREIEAPRGVCWYPAGVARLRQRLAG
jgi:hypothetical protein